MKFLTAPALLASALLSVMAVIPFHSGAKPDSRPFALEVALSSSVAGLVKVYYDIGHGFHESDSAELTLAKTNLAQTYRFPLPDATYHSIRFDPVDGPGTLTLEANLRITSDRGRLVRTIPLTDLQALDQVESLRAVDGRLEVVAAPAANDPQLLITFSPPLRLAAPFRNLIAPVLPGILGVFAAVSALLLLLDRVPRIQTRAVATARWLQERPVRALAIVAAVAVVMSAYPVVFLGRSHVSPNFGTTLLHETYPTLPGYTSSRTVDGNGSDVGAIMWAHVPYSFVQRRALARGELPLWNRYSSAGTPLLAQGQSMFGDPLHLLVIAANGAAWAWDVKYLVAKWLFAAGLGLSVLALLGRQASRPAISAAAATPAAPGIFALPAAMIVAFAAPFIGFFVYRINHPAFFSLCHAPWVLYCWIRLAQAVGRRPVTLWLAGLFVANFALFNSGTVKEAYLLLLQMNAAGAGVLLVTSTPWRERLAKLSGAAFAGLLLILVTAPVWGPFLQAVRHAFTASSHAIAYQIQPSLLIGAFDELFFRPLSEGDVVFNPALNVLFLLGLLYLLATARLHFGRHSVVALAVFAAVSLAFAFGVVPPHFIERVPLLARVGHIENCFLGGFIVLGSILAGIGFATAAGRLGTREGRLDLVITALILVTLVGAWIGFRQASHRMVFGPGTTLTLVPPNEVIAVSPFIWGSLVSLLLASVVLALVAQHAFARRTLGAGGAILAGVCVLTLLWRQGLHAANTGFEKYTVRPPVRAPFHGRSPAMDFVQAGTQAEPSRILGVHGNLTPGWNAAYGLEAIYGPDALQNRWLRELIDLSPLEWNSSWRLYCTSEDVTKSWPFFDALNVRYYADGSGNQAPLRRTLQLVREADLNVYESRTVWPRAFFTDQVQIYGDPTELMDKILAERQGRPFAAVQEPDLTDGSGLARLSRDVATRTVNAATNYALTENTTSFHVQASGPGVVVLTEAWWPDSFRVEVDGHRQPVVRVNHAFKGVVIDTAGNHEVKFTYWPRKFLQMLMLSGIGSVLLVASLVLALRPARRA